ncbi:hypothetical protein PS685_01707 [Pseudomonas fluorescens]|uniref:Uncharacterized protein n=1 Tax=Pseudomonas fluorescens TaxID=294 RepID=A0A5E6YQ28_PSEFL|nr:hypothetical protein PS685_01707 [Pseudomonas fluorescens]
MPLVEQMADLLAIALLRALQIIARAAHITGVVQRRVTVPCQIGQGLAQGHRPLAGTGTALIAPDPFIAGQTNQCSPRWQAIGHRLDPLMPAQRALPFSGINTACPQGHVGYNRHV